jgi:aspartyl aminopeptidase
VAGRVVCRVPAAAGSDSGDRWEGRLVKLDKAVARIPSLAIHLDPARDSFTFNKETQLYPLLGLSSLLNAPVPAGGEIASTAGVSDPMAGKHHPALLSLVAKELGVAVEDIADFELQLFDLQPAAIGGLADELILAGRIDNLMSSFCALEGLIAASSSSSSSQGGAKGVPTAQAILLFDNEEVGSVSHQGAESSLLPNLAARLAAAGIGRSKDDAPVRAEEVLARSFLVSADMGHGGSELCFKEKISGLLMMSVLPAALLLPDRRPPELPREASCAALRPDSDSTGSSTDLPQS